MCIASWFKYASTSQSVDRFCEGDAAVTIIRWISVICPKGQILIFANVDHSRHLVAIALRRLSIARLAGPAAHSECVS